MPATSSASRPGVAGSVQLRRSSLRFLVGLWLDLFLGHVLLRLLAPDVQVELLAVLLGMGVDPLHVLLGVAGKLLVHTGNQLRQRAHLAGPDTSYRGGDRSDQALDRAGARLQLALDPLRVGLLEQQRLVERALLLDDLRERGLVATAVVDVVDLVIVG